MVLELVLEELVLVEEDRLEEDDKDPLELATCLPLAELPLPF